MVHEDDMNPLHSLSAPAPNTLPTAPLWALRPVMEGAMTNPSIARPVLDHHGDGWHGNGETGGEA